MFASTSGNAILLLRPGDELVPQAEIDALRNPLAVSPADWPMEGRLSSGAAASLAAVHTAGDQQSQLPSSEQDSGRVDYRTLRSMPDAKDFIEDPSLSPELSALRLRNISVSISCQIPIGQTGLFLTSIRGSITLNESSTTIRWE